MKKWCSEKLSHFPDSNSGLGNPRPSEQPLSRYLGGLGFVGKQRSGTRPTPPSSSSSWGQQKAHIWQNGTEKGAGNWELHGVEERTNVCGLRGKGVRPLVDMELPLSQVTWNNLAYAGGLGIIINNVPVWMTNSLVTLAMAYIWTMLTSFHTLSCVIFTGSLYSSDSEMWWKL